MLHKGQNAPTSGREPIRSKHIKLFPVLAVLVATLGLIGAAAAGASILKADETQALDPQIQQAVDAVFADGRCVSPDEAQSAVSGALVDLGYHNWTVTLGTTRDGVSCVEPGVLATDTTVVLVPVTGPKVSAAMDGVQRELMTRCLSIDEASAFVSSVALSAGVGDFSVVSDGPIAYPSDEKDAALAHLTAGCTIYSGSGSDANGAQVFYISGS